MSWKSKIKSSVYRDHFFIEVGAEGGSVNITKNVIKVLGDSKIKDGIINIFSVGSTASIVSMENEDGLFQDLNEMLKSLFPKDGTYEHEKAWQDGNAHSHLKATVMGPEITLPIVSGDLGIGTWQHLVFINHDTRDRERSVLVTIIGV